MEAAGETFNQLTRLEELRTIAAEATKKDRSPGVSPGTIAVRPLGTVTRLTAGALYTLSGSQSTALLTNGTLLHEVQTRQIIDQLDETEKQGKKAARKEKKEEMFSALVSSKPDSKNWGKGNLQLALDYKGIMTLATSKGKKKEELLKVWQSKGNIALEAGEEEKEEGRRGGGERGGGRADARGEGGGGEG